MEADIVEDDDVTGRQCRRKLCLDPCFEDAAVHRRIDDPWSGQAMAAQPCDESLRLPVAEGSVSRKATAFGRPSGALRQTGIRGRLIDKDEPGQRLVEEPLAAVDPKITRLGYLRSALLACLEAFFYCSAQADGETARRWHGGPRCRARPVRDTIRPGSLRHAEQRAH